MTLGSFSQSVGLLQSSFTFNHRSCSFEMSSPTKGSIPLRDFTEKQPLPAKAPTPSLRSAHRLSQPFGGFIRSSAARLIPSSTPRAGFILRSGAYSLFAADLAHHKVSFLHAVETPFIHQQAGCHKLCSSTSRLCSAKRSRSSGSVISLSLGRSPPRVSGSSRSSSSSSVTPVPWCQTLMTFTTGSSR